MLVRVMYFVTLVSAVVGALMFWSGFRVAQSAPQEAAVAAGAIAMAVIPYVIARCLQLYEDFVDARRDTKRMLELLEESNSLARRRVGE